LGKVLLLIIVDNKIQSIILILNVKFMLIDLLKKLKKKYRYWFYYWSFCNSMQWMRRKQNASQESWNDWSNDNNRWAEGVVDFGQDCLMQTVSSFRHEFEDVGN